MRTERNDDEREEEERKNDERKKRLQEQTARRAAKEKALVEAKERALVEKAIAEADAIEARTELEATRAQSSEPWSSCFKTRTDRRWTV